MRIIFGVMATTLAATLLTTGTQAVKVGNAQKGIAPINVIDNSDSRPQEGAGGCGFGGGGCGGGCGMGGAIPPVIRVDKQGRILPNREDDS